MPPKKESVDSTNGNGKFYRQWVFYVIIALVFGAYGLIGNHTSSETWHTTVAEKDLLRDRVTAGQSEREAIRRDIGGFRTETIKAFRELDKDVAELAQQNARILQQHEDLLRQWAATNKK